MTPEEAVRGAAGPVGRTGAAWMFASGTAARGKQLGLSAWSYYHCGRGGVLGDGPADAAIAAFGFFPPALQRKAWDKGRAILPPSQCAREYASSCAAWGGVTFGSVPDAGRLAALLGRVTDAAEAAGQPLLAGWRALVAEVAKGQDDAARLALALQVAREHRGGAHLVAVVAQGVDPLQAVVSGRYGTANAEFFGWPQPWPDPSGAAEEMAAAERLTDRLVAPAFAALSGDERAELVAGLRALPRE